jgi:hypothetical protein
MKPEQTCQHGENGRRPEDQQRNVLLIPDDTMVVIRDLECHSQEVYAYLDTPAAQGDLVGTVIRALECGANVLTRASSRSDFEHVEKLA